MFAVLILIEALKNSQAAAGDPALQSALASLTTEVQADEAEINDLKARVTALEALNASDAAAASALIALSLTPTELPPGQVGQPYAQTLTASGGTAPYTFAADQGAMPDGLTLVPAGDSQVQVSGTPTGNGGSTFTIDVTDADGATAKFGYSITISGTPVAPSSPVPDTPAQPAPGPTAAPTEPVDETTSDATQGLTGETAES